MITEETWRPIPGIEGYEASDHGRVRSLLRGTPRVLVGTVGPCGYLTVGVQIAGRRRVRRVGSLVALAWIGPRPEGSRVRRLNGVTTDDRPENLAYGSLAEITADHVARARREEAAGAPTHCPAGHRYADSWLGAWGDRLCRECRRGEAPRTQAADVETVRYASCSECGARMPGVVGPGPLALRCHECRRRRQAESLRQYLVRRGHSFKSAEMPCEDCGTLVVQAERGAVKRRCDPCARAARNAQAAAYRERRRAEREPNVRRGACRDCGVEIVKVGPGAMRERCDECRRADAAERDRRHRARMGTMKPPETPCVDCGAPVPQHPGYGRAFLRCPACTRTERNRLWRQWKARRQADLSGESGPREVMAKTPESSDSDQESGRRRYRPGGHIQCHPRR